MSKEKSKVTDELLDLITDHSIQLQRIANGMGKDIGIKYRELAKDLTSVISSNDFTSSTVTKSRKKKLKKLLTKGKVTIHTMHQALSRSITKELVETGELEAEFALGSVNKAVTGTAKVKVVEKGVKYSKISSMADKLIVQGTPQKEAWERLDKNVQNKFKDAVRTSYENNEDLSTLFGRVRGTEANKYKDGILNTPKHQAESLARTSMHSLTNQVRQETYLANQDVIKGVQFLSHLDNRTTHICRAYSGDRWLMTPDGQYQNIEGGHEFRQPPLHYNCRSTLLPLLKTKEELTSNVLDKIPEERKDFVGELPRSDKYRDADKWLREQPESYQKDVLGKAHGLWRKGSVSFNRFVTQKGRVRTPDEVYALYTEKELVPKSISRLKTTEKFHPYTGASSEVKKKLSKIEKGYFLNIEEKLMKGKTISTADRNTVSLVLRNADPKSIELPDNYSPTDFGDFLGNKGKRLAYYNHVAKRYERIPGMRKGDLGTRATGKLDKLDQEVLDEIILKIEKDQSIPKTNKVILFDIYEESSGIVGKQRAIPIIESLLTTARKKDFKDIKGSFVGYMQQSTLNAINSYFARRKRLEIRLGDTVEKAARYEMLSDNAKSKYFSGMNKESSVKLAHTGEIKKKTATIGKRQLRDFEGDTPTSFSVDLELTPDENISNFLSNLQDNSRLDSKQIKELMERMKSPEHQWVLKSSMPGDKVVLNDKILSSDLFDFAKDHIWVGRGMPPKIRDRVGKILGDVQIYQDLSQYMRGKILTPEGMTTESYLASLLEKFSENSTSSIRKNLDSSEKMISNLYNLPGSQRRRLRAKRAKAREDMFKDGLFSSIFRKRRETIRREKLLQEREKANLDWDKQVDAVYISELSKALRDTGEVRLLKKNPLSSQAYQIYGEDSVKLARLINSYAIQGAQRGTPYVQVAKDLGDQFFYKFKKKLTVPDEEALKMGNFLLLSLEKTGKIRRRKVTSTVQGTPWEAPEKKVMWVIESADPDWEKTIMANQNNYTIDGLPSIGKPLKYNKEGIYEETGRTAVRGIKRDEIGDLIGNRKNKPALRNLDYEAATALNINGYVYDVMSEMERRGKGLGTIIPGVPKDKLDTVARSKRNSYDRARTLARTMRDETFYNGMSNDKFGRTYSTNMNLHWQGDDVHKGLMRFERGVKLGKHGYEEFARTFMNFAGFDKVPMESRIKLFDKIPDNLILDTVKDPIKYDWWYTDNDWIEKGIISNLRGIDKRDVEAIKDLAKKANPSGEGAWSTLALLKERAEMINWKRKDKKLEDFKSYLPMPRDGSNNA